MQEGTPLDTLLAQACSELPPGLRVIVIGRDPPGDAWSALLSADRLGLMVWEHLRMTRDEVMRHAAQVGATPERAVAIVARARCLAAKVALLSTLAIGDGAPGDDAAGNDAAGNNAASNDAASNDAASNDAAGNDVAGNDAAGGETIGALAALWLARKSVPDQIALLEMAVAPEISAAMVPLLASEPGRALELLARLHRDNLLVDRVDAGPAAGPAYRFHPLLREALPAQAARRLAADRLRALRMACAECLLAHGRAGLGMPLLLEAGEPGRAVRVLERAVPRLIRQGRAPAVLQAARPLPPA